MRRLLLLLALGWLLTPPCLAAEGEGIFIEASVSPPAPYVQQQVIYTLRLYRKSHLQRGHFVRPEIADALLREIDGPPPRQVSHRGESYELIEQRYRLFPQRSGRIVLPPPVFSSRELFVQGEALTLDVQPAPASQGRGWTVAGGLTLSERWETPSQPWQIGDHLRRVITVEGRDLTAAQLPDIRPQPVTGVALQQIGNELQEEEQAGRLLSRRRVTLLYLPERAGQFELPPLAVEWWNSETRASEQSLLEAVILVVEGGAPSLAAAPAVDERGRVAATAPESAFEPSSAQLYGMAAALLAALLLGIAWSSARFRALLHAGVGGARALYYAFRLLPPCLSRSPAGMKRVILRWAASVGGPGATPNLIMLAGSADQPGVAALLHALDAALYSPRPFDHHPGSCLRCLLPWMVRQGAARRRTIDPALPPLWAGKEGSQPRG